MLFVVSLLLFESLFWTSEVRFCGSPTPFESQEQEDQKCPEKQDKKSKRDMRYLYISIKSYLYLTFIAIECYMCFNVGISQAMTFRLENHKHISLKKYHHKCIAIIQYCSFKKVLQVMPQKIKEPLIQLKLVRKAFEVNH